MGGYCERKSFMLAPNNIKHRDYFAAFIMINNVCIMKAEREREPHRIKPLLTAQILLNGKHKLFIPPVLLPVYIDIFSMFVGTRVTRNNQYHCFVSV